MKTVTKKELVHRIAEQTGTTKVVAKDVIQSFLNAIIDELADGNRLEFREFGVLESRNRAARLAQNPRTLEKVPVPSKKIVKFKVGRLMRHCVAFGEVTLIAKAKDDVATLLELQAKPAAKPKADSVDPLTKHINKMMEDELRWKERIRSLTERLSPDAKKGPERIFDPDERARLESELGSYRDALTLIQGALNQRSRGSARSQDAQPSELGEAGAHS